MTAKRAASGESSIVKGDDGRWHGYVSMGLKAGGKRDRRHIAAIKRADVARRVRELEDQREAGIVLASGRGVTVEQWMRVWLDTIAAPLRRGHLPLRPSPLRVWRSETRDGRIEPLLGCRSLPDCCGRDA